jgi:hypothetical protein
MPELFTKANHHKPENHGDGAAPYERFKITKIVERATEDTNEQKHTCLRRANPGYIRWGSIPQKVDGVESLEFPPGADDAPIQCNKSVVCANAEGLNMWGVLYHVLNQKKLVARTCTQAFVVSLGIAFVAWLCVGPLMVVCASPFGAPEAFEVDTWHLSEPALSTLGTGSSTAFKFSDTFDIMQNVVAGTGCLEAFVIELN